MRESDIEEYITIRSCHQLHRIKKSDIQIIETTERPHYIMINYQHGSVVCIGKIKYFEQVLSEILIAISASCLVRKDLIHILDIHSKAVRLWDGTEKKVSVRKMKNLKTIMYGK